MANYEQQFGTLQPSFRVGGPDGIAIHEAGTVAPLSPNEGDLWFDEDLDMWLFYDVVRTKWLSVEIVPVQFSDLFGNAAGSYYQWGGGVRMSAARGLTAPYDGTVVGIDYTRDDTDAATFEVVKDGAVFSPAAELASSATSGSTMALNGNFDAGEVIAIRNKSGGNTVSNGSGTFYVRWRNS